MTPSTYKPTRLEDLPLWRLIVLLADVERELGPTCPTALAAARVLAERLSVPWPPR